jgi:hypothetical protein
VSASGVLRDGAEWDKGCKEQCRGAKTVKLHPGPRNVAMVVIYKIL